MKFENYVDVLEYFVDNYDTITEEYICCETIVIEDFVYNESGDYVNITNGYISIIDGTLAVWSGLGYEDYQFEKQLTSTEQAFNIIKLLVE